jgi:DNA-directed RNA polymerase II subunit RPB2
MILDEEDMPVTEDGVIPDVIINPHCIPSRMTIAQLIECILGKVGSLKGKFFDGTPFESFDANELGKLLEDLDFNGSGRESLYNGETGEMIKSQIFIGPTYYQRLKHMVHDKMHARATGPTNALTREPTEGRSREGGLRMGNMELDCLHAHGIAYYTQDKYIKCSDDYSTHVCDKCGLIATVNPEQNIAECKKCNNKSDFSNISLPYASKLLFSEIQGMGITTRFRTE